MGRGTKSNASIGSGWEKHAQNALQFTILSFFVLTSFLFFSNCSHLRPVFYNHRKQTVAPPAGGRITDRREGTGNRFLSPNSGKFLYIFSFLFSFFPSFSTSFPFFPLSAGRGAVRAIFLE
jgi:hypothetical protein